MEYCETCGKHFGEFGPSAKPEHECIKHTCHCGASAKWQMNAESICQKTNMGISHCLSETRARGCPLDIFYILATPIRYEEINPRIRSARRKHK